MAHKVENHNKKVYYTFCDVYLCGLLCLLFLFCSCSDLFSDWTPWWMHFKELDILPDAASQLHLMWFMHCVLLVHLLFLLYYILLCNHDPFTDSKIRRACLLGGLFIYLSTNTVLHTFISHTQLILVSQHFWGRRDNSVSRNGFLVWWNCSMLIVSRMAP